MISKDPRVHDSSTGAEQLTVRRDERTGLKAAFERVFFDVPYPPAATEALDRTAYRAATESDDGRPARGGAGESSPKTILLYRGESGIGKTRVFRQFRVYAEERRIPVYEIHCYDVEGIPLKPVLRVIREILRDFEFGDMLREKYRPGLEALLPGIFRSDGLDTAPIPSTDWSLRTRLDEDKLRIFDGLTQLLFEITALTPIVILVHDLNWGDQATIEFLRYIGRNIRLRNARFDGWSDGLEPLPSGGDWGSTLEPVVGDAPVSGEGAEFEGLDGTATDDDFPAIDGEVARGRDGTGAQPSDRPVRLMILANYQGAAATGESGSAESYLERALTSLGDEAFAYHGEVRRLNREETRRCFEAYEGSPALDDATLERLHALTEGFPSYIHEVARLVGPDGDIAAILDELESRPRSGPTRFAILERRLADANAGELAVLQALALARKPLTVQCLSAVLERSVEEVEKTLAALDGRAFVERVGQLFPRGGEHDGVYFRIWDYPDVVSETITDPDERRRLHDRIAAEVRRKTEIDRDERFFEVFYHLRRGSDVESAVPFGIRAASRFGRAFAIEKAIFLLDDLLSLLGTEQHRDERLAVLEGKAAFHFAIGEFDRARETLGTVLEEAGEDLDDERRAELEMRQGEIERVSGDTNRALKDLNRAFKSIKEIETPLGAQWHLDTARVRLDRADNKRASNLCLKGLKICQKRLDEIEAARAAAASGDASGGEKAVDAPGGPSGDVGPTGGTGAAGEDEWRAFLRLKAEFSKVLARTFVAKANYVHAVENFRRALDAFEKLEDEPATANVLDDLGTVYLEQGTYFRAARYFFRALEIKRRGQDIAGLCLSYDQLGMVYLRTGDVLKTIAYLNQSIHLKEKIGDFHGLNPTLGVMGELYARLGRYTNALAFFDREIHSSEIIKDTKGLVDAFVRKGWLYHELGDAKQVERLTRQTSILASEFKLRFQEANSARLRGACEALRRNWDEAEAQLKKATELYAKLGNRRQEARILLDQATVKYEREAYDEGLKLASKAMVLADQLQAVDLQVRAHTIKGNIYRFLKGGNPEKVREHLGRALEQAQNLNDVHRLFEIYYSYAKLYHYDRDFLEAGNYYGKAEAILRRIADDLSGDVAARYFEDPRRKLFLEDANRFRREVQGRSAPVGTVIGSAPEKRLVGLNDFKELNSRLLRINAAQNSADFLDVVLREALELAKCERGMVLRVRNRQYSVSAHHSFGEHPEKSADFTSAESVAEDAIRRGRSLLVSGGEGKEKEKEDRQLRSNPSTNRTFIVVPIKTAERIYGAIYVDRDLTMGALTDADQQIVESFAEHVSVALDNRRHLEVSICEPLTGLYTTSYLIQRLRESYRQSNLHGRQFFLIGFYLSTLEASMRDEPRLLGERLSVELAAEIPSNAIASWGSPILSVLVNDASLAYVDDLAQRILGRLLPIVNMRVPHEILGAEARIPNGLSLYYEMRRKLLPEESDQQTLIEIRNLLSQEITLKDAKMVLEKHIIENTLRKTGGNITHAAKELGIHRPQLSSLLKKHHLKRERFERGLEFDEEAASLEARRGPGANDGD